MSKLSLHKIINQLHMGNVLILRSTEKRKKEEKNLRCKIALLKKQIYYRFDEINYWIIFYKSK